MAREAPSALGTSLIDLLIGALAMVTLLWAASPRNEPEPRNETISALAVIDQFGTTHVRTLAVEEPGRWRCEGWIDWKHGRVHPLHCTPLGGRPTPKRLPDGTGVERPGQRTQDPPLTVRWHAHQSQGGDYTATLTVSATEIGAEGLVLETGIVPCCHPHDPHYLRIFTRAQGAKEERFALWHEQSKLQSVLDSHRPVTTPWIDRFRAGVRTGAIVPEIVAFDARGEHCSTWRKRIHMQARNPTTVRITFAPDKSAEIEVPGDTGPGTTRPDPTLHALLARYAGATTP